MFHCPHRMWFVVYRNCFMENGAYIMVHTLCWTDHRKLSRCWRDDEVGDSASTESESTLCNRPKFGICEARLRSSYQAIERAIDWAIERSRDRWTERSSERTSDRAIIRAIERSRERSCELAVERSSEHSHERSRKRSSGRFIRRSKIVIGHNSSPKSPVDIRTSALCKIVQD